MALNWLINHKTFITAMTISKISQLITMSGLRTCLAIATLVPFINTQSSNETKMEPFVVKGDFAKINNFPHSVFIYADCMGKWTCGTSVLNQKILLTAAHCLYGCNARSKIDAFAGHENVKKTTVKRKIVKILVHERYNDKTIQNDIGLLLLKNDLPLGDKIKRVILNKQNYVGIQAVVAGWGLVNDDTKEGTDRLKWTKSTVRSKSTCRRIGTLSPGMMCAGSLDNECGRPSQGDSGSALVTTDYRQIGIVSFRLPPHPALVIYSNVSFYYEWIQYNSQALYCGKKFTSTLIT